MHTDSIDNLERALLERNLYVPKGGEFVPPPLPNKLHFNVTLSKFYKQFVRCLGNCSPWSHGEFVSSYQGLRRARYQQAADSLAVRPVEKRDSFIRAFVKAEKINCSAKVNPAPRVIQPRDPRYNVEVGCYLKPLEHRVYQAIAKVFGDETVSKGMNARQVGELCARKWGRFRQPVALGLDASRFDQHVSEVALMWEHAIYLNAYKGDKKLKELLKWQLRCVGSGYCRDGRLKYGNVGTRMSGDMNTAMGNCLLMCAMVYSYMGAIGVEFELINNGDDCTLIFERSHLRLVQQNLHQWFLMMGFSMKVEDPVYHIERISFCQTSPIWTPLGYTMVRDPHIAFAKDSVSIHQWTDKAQWQGYLGVLGKGGLSLTSGIPMWQSFYHRMVRCSGGKVIKSHVYEESGLAMLAKNMEGGVREVHPLTRESFRVAFGIDSDYQVVIERELDQGIWQWNTPLPLEGHADYKAWPRRDYPYDRL